MLESIAIYPGYSFTYEREDKDITINSRSFDNFYCSVADGYTDDGGYYHETGSHEETFTLSEMKKMLRVKHIIWEDGDSDTYTAYPWSLEL